MPRGNVAIWAGLSVIAAAAVMTLLFTAEPIVLTGAVIQRAPDSSKESPIADVEVSAEDNLASGVAKSDFSGFFKLTLDPGVKAGQLVKLEFRHSGYQPLELKIAIGARPLVVRMTPLHPQVRSERQGPAVVVSNLIIRYSIESSTTTIIGTVAKTFQVANTGGIPCNGRRPCSPDGKWKAAVGGISLDAGDGNEFQNARFSCIAGPCPFTRTVSDHFSKGGRNIGVSVLDWSDTATFLLEADVERQGIRDNIETAYPVMLGESLDFTLPQGAEGPSIEAEIDGELTIYPLGPTADLSWADCDVKTDKNRSKIYRCNLKPGYRFR